MAKKKSKKVEQKEMEDKTKTQSGVSKHNQRHVH
jgi:hypothetical protein